MKLKNIAYSGLLVLFGAQSVYAGTCEPNDRYSYNSSMTPEECATVAAGVTGAAASGIYAAKKYSNAKIYEVKHTQSLFAETGKPKVLSIDASRSYVNRITDGDKISFTYELNEIQNREYHINLMEEKAASARSSASSARVMAMTAMKSQSTGSGKNRVTTMVPDHAARMMHAARAIRLDGEAVEYDRKAASARAGGVVPTYTLNKVVDADAGTRNLSQDFINERAKNTSKIKTITRLPVDNFKQLKRIVNKGRAGLVGVGVGLIFAGEEFISGKAAQALEDNDIPFKIDLSEGE
jgi:hypothetical protein